VEIERLVWYPENMAKLTTHGVWPVEADAMILEDRWVVDRIPGHPEQVRVIGYAAATRRLITLVLDPTDDPVAWRPVTG